MELEQYLSQDKLWIGKNGQTVIAEMTVDWRVKSAKWLMRHARVMHAVICAGKNEDAAHGDCDVSAVMQVVTQNPHAWMRKTPLYLALCAGIDMGAYVLVEGTRGNSTG